MKRKGRRFSFERLNKDQVINNDRFKCFGYFYYTLGSPAHSSLRSIFIDVPNSTT